MDNILNVSVNKKEQPFHWHERMEITLVVRGSAEGIINNESSRLTAGDLWVVNRDVVHCLENCSDDVVFVQIHMNMEKFNQYIPNIWTVYFKCGPNNDDAVSNDLKNEIRGRVCAIVNMMDSKVHNLHVDNKIIYACIEILNDLKLGFNMIGKGAADNERNENFDRIWRVTDYIYDNCNRKLTLKEVADREYVSEAYLSKIMKKETGDSFKETVAYLRAECSIRYLLETDMSVTDISYECGFSAPRYYNAAFQKRFHCTPIEYRKKIRNSLKYINDVSADSIVFQEVINKEEVRELLQKYSKDTYLAWEAIRIRIDLDNLNALRKYKKNPFRKDTLCCTIKDILSFEKQKTIRTCKEQLHIKNVLLEDGYDNHYEDIAAKNIKFLGMEAVQSSGDTIALDELYDDRNVAKSKFYMQKLLNEISDNYMALSENVFAYESGPELNIILLNDIKMREKRFNLSFKGAKAQRPFAVRTKTASEHENTVMPRRESEMDVRLTDALRAPKETIETTDNLILYTLEELLEGRQVKRITIVPL